MAQAGHGAVHYPPAGREMWAGGLELFAGVMMIIIGLFHVVVGLAAILQSSVYMMTANYIFDLSISGWGWVHLILGILVGLTGLALVTGMQWARAVGIVIVGISALANFLFIPYQPVWSLLIVVVDVAIIWALAVRTRELTAGGEPPTRSEPERPAE
jgi:hypothetical protein